LKLSIIIATHRRPAALARLLESIAPQMIPERHELFIAENGSPVPVALAPIAVPLTRIHDSRPGKCRVQNRALADARGEIAICLDDDLTVVDDYLAQAERFFDHYREFAAMKGRIIPAEDPHARAGEMWPYLDLPIVDHGDAVVEVRGVLGANMAFRMEALRRIGFFDERLGPGAAGHEEETEISQRLRRASFRIGYAPGALVYHEVDPARADRARFIRIARERGLCRTLHERHSRVRVEFDAALAALRLTAARAAGASITRIAREERRLAVARGMRDGLVAGAAQRLSSRPSKSTP
jgi:GT2 family glycosyltransferase